MIRLRNLQPEDSTQLLQWRNRPEIARYMYSDHRISEAEHSRWFERALEDARRTYWVIVLDDEDVGLANLYDIDRTHSRASWAFYLASTSIRGRGVGGFVEYWVLSHAFDKLGLNKLCCEVLAFNEAVEKMHLSFGFSREGLYRRHIRKGDQWQDVVAMAMLHSEWLELRDGIRQRLVAKGLLESSSGGSDS